MDGNLSVADAMALRDNNNGFMGGNSAWLILLFFFIFGYGNGGYGNGGVSRADLAQSFDFNNLNRQVLDINNSLCHCCCETNRNIDSVKNEICNQTNTLANAIHNEGETTRALINANIMQNLRDENSALKFNISQQVQTKNILDNLGRYVTNEPCPQYPYGFGYGFGCNGCGFN